VLSRRQKDPAQEQKTVATILNVQGILGAPVDKLGTFSIPIEDRSDAAHD
jgi:hypothetical protein